MREPPKFLTASPPINRYPSSGWSQIDQSLVLKLSPTFHTLGIIMGYTGGIIMKIIMAIIAIIQWEYKI